MPPNSAFTLEICIESAAGLAACQDLADRIELCAGLDMGGLTPSHGLMALAQTSGIETHVLIRPRTGDFELSAEDLKVALADIQTAKSLGLKGVVIGALQSGALDRPALSQMIAAAEGLTTTLHRAFDITDDRSVTLEQAISLGMDRILTSGAAPTAFAGIRELARLRAQAADRIEIMAGSGITRANLAEIVARTQITSFHASCSSQTTLSGPVTDLGFGSHNRATDRAEVTKLRAILDAL